MKTKSIVTIAVITLLPLLGFAQAPAPPVPPVPPANRLIPPEPGDKEPKVPVTYLGVNTSDVPSVLCDQLGMPKGFGVVVDYVEPNGPAAAAGVQQNDIIKMLNDQILTGPSQLAKLVRSFQEGTSITLTLVRKGQEQKVTVKLAKKEVSRRHAGMHGPPWEWNFGEMGDFNKDMENLKDHLGDEKQGMIHDAVMRAQEEAQHAREQAQRVREQVQRVREEAQRAREEGRRARGAIRIQSSNDGTLRSTRIDLGKAQIAYTDDKGELKIEMADGKKLLTAKDPQGKLIFSGPVETKEDLDKVPADVRQRYEKIEQKDLPEIAPAIVDSDDDADDMDNDNDADDDSAGNSVQQVSNQIQIFPHQFWMFSRAVVI